MTTLSPKDRAETTPATRCPEPGRRTGRPVEGRRPEPRPEAHEGPAEGRRPEALEGQGHRDPWLKLAVLWSIILLWGVLWLSSRPASGPLGLTVVPEVPKDGQPVVVALEVTNPRDQEETFRHELFLGNTMLQSGASTLPSQGSRIYKYVHKVDLAAGRQLNFVARVTTERESWERTLSLPPYPPQVWSSFVSFATFSTSMMGSISAVAYYKEHFVSAEGMNAGFLLILTLLVLVVFQDMTGPLSRLMPNSLLGRLNRQFRELVVILGLIFLGICYTVIVLRF
ncbi:MAG: hypothetical protein HYY02_12710 [Chloroflexi bacterium]|nr:hypothetical protein [Chloroflexota bacterium]